MPNYLLCSLCLFVFSQTCFGQTELFTPVQESQGLNHYMKHENFMGGGIAFVDINGDGYDDIYLVSGKLADQLYLNDGSGNFENISDQSGISTLTEEVYSNSVNFADVDRDGDQDLFICTTDDKTGADAPNLLLINDGNLQFSNVWNSDDKAMSLGASFLDYNKDGFIDIYVLNYVEEVKFIYNDDNEAIGYDHTCTGNWFYINNGDGSFIEIGENLGLADTGCALAVMATDIDQDLDADMLIANDFGAFIEPNKLYQNNLAEDNFSEEGATFNANSAMYGMGISAADVDLDGDLDYYFSNFGANELLINEGTVFVNEAEERGVDDMFASDSLYSVSWGTTFTDFDNDLDADLYVSNGFVPSLDFITAANQNNDRFYINLGNGYFESIEPDLSGIDDLNINRGMAHSDFDNDGDVDFMTLSFRVPNSDTTIISQLYRNNLENENHWLQVDLQGVVSNTNAFGAKVKLYCNDMVLVQELYGGSSHCSQHSSTLHFGLGDFDKVDSISIDWPSSMPQQKLFNVPANQRILIVEGEDFPSNVDKANLDFNLKLYPNPTNGIVNIAADQQILEVIKSYTIYNALGKRIDDHDYTNQSLNFQGLPGMYFVDFLMDDGLTIRRQIVKK